MLRQSVSIRTLHQRCQLSIPSRSCGSNDDVKKQHLLQGGSGRVASWASHLHKQLCCRDSRLVALWHVAANPKAVLPPPISFARVSAADQRKLQAAIGEVNQRSRVSKHAGTLPDIFPLDLGCAVLCCAVLCCAVLYCVAFCHIVLCCAVLSVLYCSILPHCAVPCCALLRDTMICWVEGWAAKSCVPVLLS